MFLYIFIYISPHTLLINSLNWSSGIGITGVEEILVEEGREGTEWREEVLEEEERGTQGIKVEEATERTEGTEEGGSRVSDFIWSSSSAKRS